MDLGNAAYDKIDEIVHQNRMLIQELNSSVNSLSDVREKLEQITNEKIDESTEINVPFQTDFGRNLHIGKHVFINSGAMMVDLGGIYISDHVLIGPNVTITSVNHRIKPSERRNLDLKPVCIHDNAWLGANVTVAPGVTIGENAIVAAGAVVTKDVAKNTVVAGVPARAIKRIKE